MKSFNPNKEFDKFLHEAGPHELPRDGAELLKMKIAHVDGFMMGVRFARESYKSLPNAN